MPVSPSGPWDATIMIVGEAPGENEVQANRPFVGYSGQLLDSMLAEAGINRGSCFITNVCRERPPSNDIGKWMPTTKKAQKEMLDAGIGTTLNNIVVHHHVASGYAELQNELQRVNPRLVICLGNTALWAVCGISGISSWRGSTLTDSAGRIVVPTYHPAAVLRQWSLRGTVVQDLVRANYVLKHGINKPLWCFTIRPTLAQARIALKRLYEQANDSPLTLAVDIETSCGYTTCIGIAWTTTDAICIPFVTCGDHYWSQEDESEIVYLLSKLLTHGGVTVVGQNFIYDAQYIYKHWHFYPRTVRDTMLAHHLLFARQPKSLDYIASMFCSYYVYWKDDGKDWRGDCDEERYWRYNCEDCVRTLECDMELQQLIDEEGLRPQYDFQMSMWHCVLRMMIRGMRVDKEEWNRLRGVLKDHASNCLREVEGMVGYAINPRSNPQMQQFFYEEMGLPVQHKRKTHAASCDDEALSKLAEKEPLVRPIVSRIAEYRSCETLLSNALKTGTFSEDGRMRSSFNIAGTDTFRLSSSTDAFGSGMNLMNIKGEDK